MASRNQRKKKRTNKRNADNARKEQAHAGQAARGPQRTPGSHVPRRSSETKSSLRTTELIAYVATVLAIVMTALAVDADGEGGVDPFGAETALRYITYLTVGYMAARGLAKAGSWRTDPHDSDAHDSTDEQEAALVGTHGPGLATEPAVDAVGDDTDRTTPESRTDSTGTRESGTSDDDDADVSVLPAVDEAPAGEKAAASRGQSAAS